MKTDIGYFWCRAALQGSSFATSVFLLIPPINLVLFLNYLENMKHHLELWHLKLLWGLSHKFLLASISCTLPLFDQPSFLFIGNTEDGLVHQILLI